MRSRTSGISARRRASEKRQSRRRAHDLGVVERAQVVGVHGRQLHEIEHRPAQAHAIERERRHHLGERELLAVARDRPAHRAEVVEQRLGQEAGVAVVVERDRVLALRDLRLVGVAQQRHVHPLRRLPAERLVELHVLGRRRQPLLGADHVRDLHQVIVDDVGEVVGREAVGLEQDLVVDLRVLELHLAAQAIDEHDLAGARHRQPHDERLAGGDARGPSSARGARGTGRRSRRTAPGAAARGARPRAARRCRSSGRPRPTPAASRSSRW